MDFSFLAQANSGILDSILPGLAGNGVTLGGLLLYIYRSQKKNEQESKKRDQVIEKKVDKIHSYMTNGVDGEGLTQKLVTRREWEMHLQEKHGG